MHRVTVIERGRLIRADASADRSTNDGVNAAGTPSRRHLPAGLYDRLLRAESAREDRGEPAIFHWRRNHCLVGPWVGVVQIPGLQVEILPKIDESEPTAEVETFSLLFDMERVFERYIAAFLATHVIPRIDGVRLFPQARGQRLGLYREGVDRNRADPSDTDRNHADTADPARNHADTADPDRNHADPVGREVLRLAPDLLFTRDTTGDPQRLIIDTKWKRLPDRSTARPGNADLYQLYAYLHRYDCKCAFLLYPHTDGAAMRDFDALARHVDDKVGTVGVRFVDLRHRLWTGAGRKALAAQLDTLTHFGVRSLMVAWGVSFPTPAPTPCARTPIEGALPVCPTAPI